MTISVQVLTRRPTDETTTIVMPSWWRDIEVIKRFAAEDY
jgi:hypothetical protein